MRLTKVTRQATTVFVLGLALGGCGGHKVVSTKPIDVSIPPELLKAFEVKELPPTAGPAGPSGALAQAPAGPSGEEEGRKGRHHRKHREKPKPKPKPAEAAAPKSEVGMSGPGASAADIPNRRPSPDPIRVGEKIWMDVSWLNTKAGEFELEVLPFKELDGRKVYDLKGSARTSDLFSLVYKADDWVESFVDFYGWFPYKFVLHGDETKHIRNNVELFDHRAGKQFVVTSDNRVQKGELVEEKGVKDLTPLTQDSLSAIYYVRTFPFEIGKTIKFPMTTNGNQWETEVNVLAREEVQTKMGYLNAFKCRIETRFKGELKQEGDAFMWFADDEHKYLLRFEAKVRIGWITGVTKRIDPGSAEAVVPEPLQQPKPDPAKAPDPRSSQAEPAAPPPESRQHGWHRPWFHQLMESLSGIGKKSASE